MSHLRSVMEQLIFNNDSLIAVGKTAEIFKWTDGKVIKLFHAGMPIEYAQHEVAMTQAIYGASISCPQVGDVIEINGRLGIELQHIVGPTLLEVWLQNPTVTKPIADTLASLHQKMHSMAAPPIEAMPTQREWVHNMISDSVRLTPEQKDTTLQKLSCLDDGAMMCHGDFHPANIICRDDGKSFVIDWFSAVSGHPLGDVARTCWLLTRYPLPNVLHHILTPELRQQLKADYLAAYFKKATVSATTLPTWEQVIADAVA